MPAGSVTVLRGAWAPPLVLDPPLCPGCLCCPSSKTDNVTCVCTACWSLACEVGFHSRMALPSPQCCAGAHCAVPTLRAGGLSSTKLSTADFCQQPRNKGCAGNELTTSCESCCPASQGMLVHPPHSKPPSAFSYWLSVCAQQAKNGGEQLS